MIALLCQANDLANEVHAQGLAALPAGDVGTRYDMPKPPTRPVPAVQAPAAARQGSAKREAGSPR